MLDAAPLVERQANCEKAYYIANVQYNLPPCELVVSAKQCKIIKRRNPKDHIQEIAQAGTVKTEQPAVQQVVDEINQPCRQKSQYVGEQILCDRTAGEHPNQNGHGIKCRPEQKLYSSPLQNICDREHRRILNETHYN